MRTGSWRTPSRAVAQSPRDKERPRVGEVGGERWIYSGKTGVPLRTQVKPCWAPRDEPSFGRTKGKLVFESAPSGCWFVAGPPQQKKDFVCSSGFLQLVRSPSGLQRSVQHVLGLRVRVRLWRVGPFVVHFHRDHSVATLRVGKPAVGGSISQGSPLHSHPHVLLGVDVGSPHTNWQATPHDGKSPDQFLGSLVLV